MIGDTTKLVSRAETASRESKYIEFKQEFDDSSTAAWCEVIKDIVAIANSGGGLILFGIADNGSDAGVSVDNVSAFDLADMMNRLGKYTNSQVPDLEMIQIARGTKRFPALLISGVETPLIFTKPGTYPIEGGKQKTAFAQGTVYFRHGAKSEPGNHDDLRMWRDREVLRIRKTWLGGIRKVVEAPKDHVVAIVPTESPLSGRPVRVGAEISVDASVGTKVVPINAEELFPSRQKDLLRKVNSLLTGQKITSHDIQCVNRRFDVMKSRPRFAYKPYRLSAPQYSDEYVEWIVEQIRENPNFLPECREAWREASRKK